MYPDRILGQVRIEHVDNASEMGRQAGRNLAGSDETYTHTPMFYSDIFSDGYEAVGRLDSRLVVVEDWAAEDAAERCPSDSGNTATNETATNDTATNDTATNDTATNDTATNPAEGDSTGPQRPGVLYYCEDTEDTEDSEDTESEDAAAV